MRYALPLALAALAGGVAAAGEKVENGFTADRPGMGLAAEVLPRGAVQIESGVAVFSEAGGRVTSSFGSPAFRVGVGRRLELRLEGDGYELSALRHADWVRGWSDLGLGAKFRVFTDRGWLPAVTLVPGVSVPAGGDEFTSSGFDPRVGMAWSKKLPAEFAVSGTLGVSASSGDSGRFAQSVVGFLVGHPAFGGWDVYAEVRRLSALDRGGRAERMLGTGFSRIVRKKAQMDVQAGHTAGGCRSAWFVGAGVAVRIR